MKRKKPTRKAVWPLFWTHWIRKFLVFNFIFLKKLKKSCICILYCYRCWVQGAFVSIIKSSIKQENSEAPHFVFIQGKVKFIASYQLNLPVCSIFYWSGAPQEALGWVCFNKFRLLVNYPPCTIFSIPLPFVENLRQWSNRFLDWIDSPHLWSLPFGLLDCCFRYFWLFTIYNYRSQQKCNCFKNFCVAAVSWLFKHVFIGPAPRVICNQLRPSVSSQRQLVVVSS